MRLIRFYNGQLVANQPTTKTNRRQQASKAQTTKTGCILNYILSLVEAILVTPAQSSSSRVRTLCLKRYVRFFPLQFPAELIPPAGS